MCQASSNSFSAIRSAAFVLICLFAVSSRSRGQENAVDGKPPAKFASLYGSEVIELDVSGHHAFIVQPTEAAVSGNKPWIWYAPSLQDEGGQWNLPSERHAKLIRPLLEKGFYFCGVDVGESYGSPQGRSVFTEFHDIVIKRYGLDHKACLFPVSRGGLMHYTWAVEHPDAVLCIGAIYPVCNLAAYPRLERLSQAWGVSKEELQPLIEEQNPVARLEALAEVKVPLLHLHGDKDQVVPIDAHSAEIERRYSALGGTMQLIVIPGKGHELAAEYWENPVLSEFFIEHGLQTAVAAEKR